MNGYTKWLGSMVAAVLVLAVGTTAQATYRDLMGFPELEEKLGSNIPTGAGFHVMQVEGLESGNYGPNPSNTELNTKTFNFMSGATGTSTHATRVARNFYGSSTSIAPGISTIDVYEAGNWLQSGFLRTTANQLPATTSARVVNHSWIGSFGDSGLDGEALRRFDYVVHADDLIQVAGVPNSSTSGSPFWRDSYNAITVGLTNGSHQSGTAAVDSLYTSGRVAPTLVAPGFRHDDGGSPLTSWATAMVSAGATLLLEVGEDASLSNGTLTNRTRTINYAQTSEVIKAVLMAGADRYVENPRGASLTTYTINTANNLSSTYGAGQMNIFNSYLILAAGQQASLEDGGGNIGRYGWDYDPAFGGASGSNSVGTYRFIADESMASVIASLVWNLGVDITTGPGPFGTPTITDSFYNLDLYLYDITDTEDLIAYSTSLNENTENIMYSGLVVGREYEFRVMGGAGQDPFLWDYAFAWQFIPEPGSVLILSVLSLGMVMRRQR